MTSKHPLVSITIITMNHEKFIEQACQSAISQTYPNLEIVLLDNCSSDATFEKAKAVLATGKIPYKAFKNTEKFGIAKNLNILVSKSSGDYICILSGDDWFTPNSVEEKLKFLQNHSIDFVLTDGYRFLEEEQKTVDAYDDHKKNKIIKSMSNFFHDNVTQNEPYNVGVLVKKEALLRFPFDENIHTEDWDMNLKLTYNGLKVGFLDKKLFYYRILKTSLSKNWELMLLSYKKVTDKYIDYIKKDKDLLIRYKANLLKHEYELLLSKETSEEKRKKLKKEWTIKKYKIKYKQPILFFKIAIATLFK